VKYYIGQLLASTAFTIVTLYYPLRYYEETGSTLYLSLLVTYYNVMNAIGSYFWGWLIDNSRRRKELFLLYTASGIPILFGLDTEAYPYVYGLVGFISSLGGPLYSTFILERFDVDSLPKQNSLLSIATIGGNVLGSLIVPEVSFREPVLLTLFTAAFLVSAVVMPNYEGEPRADKAERRNDVVTAFRPITIMFVFSFSAEIFYILFIPLLQSYRLPHSVYYTSYFLLYVTQIALFYAAPRIVKGIEGLTALTSVMGRMIVLYWIVSKMPITPVSAAALFVAFGSMWSFFSTSFYSLVLKRLRSNRGQVIGLLNASGDIGSSIGSFVPSLLNEYPLYVSYEVSYVGFALSGAMWIAYVKALKTPSSSRPPRRVSSQPRLRERIPAFLKVFRSHRP